MDKPTMRTTYDWVMEILTFFILVSTFYPFLQCKLNGIFPLETEVYDCSQLLDLPKIASIIYIALNILDWCYKIYNLPITVTKENANALYRLGVQLIRHVRYIAILMYACASNISFAIDTGKISSSYDFVISISVVPMYIIIVIYIIKMIRLRNR